MQTSFTLIFNCRNTHAHIDTNINTYTCTSIAVPSKIPRNTHLNRVSLFFHTEFLSIVRNINEPITTADAAMKIFL